MLLQRLSQALGALKKGYAIDTNLGGFPVHQVTKAPAAGTNTAVHAAVTLTTAAQTITEAISSPDFPRALLVKGNASGIAGDVVIHGKDHADRSISETIALSGASAVQGKLAFKTVTSFELPAKTNTSGDTVSIGTTNKLGLYRPIVGAALALLTVDTTVEVEAAIDTTYNTYTPTTTPNGTKVFKADYLTDLF